MSLLGHRKWQLWGWDPATCCSNYSRWIVVHKKFKKPLSYLRFTVIKYHDVCKEHSVRDKKAQVSGPIPSSSNSARPMGPGFSILNKQARIFQLCSQKPSGLPQSKTGVTNGRAQTLWLYLLLTVSFSVKLHLKRELHLLEKLYK
jgi:hypothetical protein